MSQLSAVQKARRILSNYEEIEPRKCTVQPHPRSGSKSKRPVSASHSVSQSHSASKKDFSFCRSALREAPSPSRPIPNCSFTSLYARETRYDKIMRLKVKPTRGEGARERNKQSVLEGSRSSTGSADKENRTRNQSRLERIMGLKIAKPQVASTLNNYRPPQAPRAPTKERAESAAK